MVSLCFIQSLEKLFHHVKSCLNSIPIVAHMASNYLQNRMVYFPLAFLPFRVPKQPCPFKENSSKGANESSSYFKRRFKRQSSRIFSLQLFSVLQFLFPFLVLSIQSTNFIRKNSYIPSLSLIQFSRRKGIVRRKSLARWRPAVGESEIAGYCKRCSRK